jgi:hypothetical protein
MKIDGGCHCGYITYTAEIDPDNVGICHCTDCQTPSGSAFRTSVRAAKDAFSLRGGHPKIYVRLPKAAPSAPKRSVPSAGRRFIRQRQPILRHSISAWARRASEPSYARNHKGGAAPHATGSWICTP